MTLQGKGLGFIQNGAIGIENGKIAFIGKSTDLKYKEADQVINGADHITMPGLINAHTHTGLTLLRGGAQDLPEIEWMNKGVGPLTKYLSKEDLILGSKIAVIEGLKSGTTTFAEFASFVSGIVQEVYLPLKVRVVAIETINDVSSNRSHLKPTDLYEFDQSKGEKALIRANDVFRLFRDEELVTSMYGPQALDFCSLDLLKEVKQQAIDRNCNVHMHVAQGERERLQINSRYGKDSTTISVLQNNGILDDKLIAAHIHDTTVQERLLMVRSGVKMVGCPSSIAIIDGSVPPLGSYVELGGKAAIGTDQGPGPGHYNMFQEMRMASVLTKILHKDPTALPPWHALRLATLGGAEILGLEKKIGSLEVGKHADIITIDLKRMNMTPVVVKPFKTFVPNLVYSTTGTEIDNVIINGKLVIKNSQLLNIDEFSLIQEANNRAKNIFDEATKDWFKAGSRMVSYYQEGFL